MPSQLADVHDVRPISEAFDRPEDQGSLSGHGNKEPLECILAAFRGPPGASAKPSLEPLERLSAALGGPVHLDQARRLHRASLSGGGNKTRKLEFLMADAGWSAGADIVVTQGATAGRNLRPPDGGLRRQARPRLPHPARGRTGFRDPDYTANGTCCWTGSTARRWSTAPAAST